MKPAFIEILKPISIGRLHPMEVKMIKPMIEQKENEEEKIIVELYFSCILTPLENEEDAKKLNEILRWSIRFEIYDDNKQFLILYQKFKEYIYREEEDICKKNLCNSLHYLHNMRGNFYPWLERLLSYTVLHTYGTKVYDRIIYGENVNK